MLILWYIMVGCLLSTDFESVKENGWIAGEHGRFSGKEP